MNRYLLITDTSGDTIVLDRFNDGFLFEVIAMYLEDDNVTGFQQDLILLEVESGLSAFSSESYDFVVFESTAIYDAMRGGELQ